MTDPHRSWTRGTTADLTRARLAHLVVVLAALLVSIVALPAGATAASRAVGETDPAQVGVWPLVPRPSVVHGFDPPSCTWCPGHRGVDLAGTVVEPVRAVLPGRVVYAAVLAGRGVVVVDHGGVRTTYEPVAPTVRRGAVIAAGSVIGRLETIGSHCFPAACLHLGLIRDSDDVYLDPLSILPASPRPVRLLPLWSSLPATLLGRDAALTPAATSAP